MKTQTKILSKEKKNRSAKTYIQGFFTEALF